MGIYWQRRRAIRNVQRMIRTKFQIACEHGRMIGLCFSLALIFSPAGHTNPEGGDVVSGDATITQVSPEQLDIIQASDKAIINWDSFSIETGETTQFVQPSTDAIALNRIIGADPSLIFGQLTANGRIILVNPNGVLFGEGSVIDVGGLIATTHDIDDQDFLQGNYIFDKSGGSNASVVNEGLITARESGLVAFVAPSVRNSGVIIAKLGHVELGAASSFTLDFYGDSLISFPVDATLLEQVVGPDGEPVVSLVDMDGVIDVGGGTVILSARAAREIVNNAISVGGEIVATNFEAQGGKIILSGGEAGKVSASGTLDASGHQGGTIDISGDVVMADGLIKATGMNDEIVEITKVEIVQGTSDTARHVEGGGEVVTREITVPGGTGGDVTIDGESWVSIGGNIDVSGSSGGTVDIEAGGLSLAGGIEARGQDAQGGNVTIHADGQAWVFSTAGIDASGQSGGTITQTSDQQITTSGTYLALGTEHAGGQIDMTAPVTKLLSPTLATSGLTSGGRVRIGGEFQGGKDLAVDELANASVTIATDGTRIYANTMGTSGNGGEVIIWSDNETIFLGSIEAMPGALAGDGGFVEISSANELTFNGDVRTGISDRQGTVLLDPKNITIVDGTFDQLALILGYNYSGSPDGLSGPTLDVYDHFGQSVSLDGNRLAVGAPGDSGAGDSVARSGAVYLFTFADNHFNSAKLEAMIGLGYTGGKNVSVASLEFDDGFGRSLSLDGNRLVVGASEDNGWNNAAPRSGAVYLFTFSDLFFSNGEHVGTMGHGYTPTVDLPKSVDMSNTIAHSDWFGDSVSLDGTRLAIGTSGDVDSSPVGYSYNYGAVHLVTFSDMAFSDGALVGSIGRNYTGSQSVDLNGLLNVWDYFGGAVSLDGTRLVVGARYDDVGGYDKGAVYLFTFDDASFNGAAHVGTIGPGYSGGRNIDMSATFAGAANVNLGSALSLDGNRLAVGARADSGSGNALPQSGAVYLFTFTDEAFNGGAFVGSIGYGYAGSQSVNMAGMLDANDNFGRAVALDGARLAVGAPGDDGANNTIESSGAVYLFIFSDASFNDGSLEAKIGAGYTGGKNIDLSSSLDSGDGFGSSVSLDGNHLAVGAWSDGGSGAINAYSGAVYLFSFSNELFNGARLEAIIGSGYTGGKNVDVPTLDSGDWFGSSVSLDGNRLAVGAGGDDGASNSVTNSGAVYLFTFTDTTFNDGSLEATIGAGYVGDKNLNVVSLQSYNNFGYSVSLDGDRLAVGAVGDSGIADGVFKAGAVYLFSFADGSFSSGSLEGIIGAGYAGGKNVDVTTLDDLDWFGISVSLDGNRLAVGAQGDDGASNVLFNTGAVYLFTFADASFNDNSLEGIIGASYAGGKDVDVTTLNDLDWFGTSVSLDGNRLAVGAFRDDGAINDISDVGAVYLFTFTDTSFNGGNSDYIIGVGYSGGKNIDLSSSLDAYDNFGWSISLDGDRLAVGADWDDGSGNTLVDSGAVYLFNLSGSKTFGASPSSDATIPVGTLTALLDTGSNVILQANNDFTLATNLIVDNTAGDGGMLTIQAGRSILLDGNVVTDNGDLAIIGNEPLAAGVVDAYRDTGAAVITMAPGTHIDAGTGDVRISLLNGTGKTYTDGGDISLTDISAGSVIVENLGGGDVVLNGTIAAPGASGATPIVIASAFGNFINNAGSGALDPGAGRYLVYSQNPGLDLINGLVAGEVFSTSYNALNPSGIAEPGDLFVYIADPPTLAIAPEGILLAAQIQSATVLSASETGWWESIWNWIKNSLAPIVGSDTSISDDTSSGFLESLTAISQLREGNYRNKFGDMVDGFKVQDLTCLSTIYTIISRASPDTSDVKIDKYWDDELGAVNQPFEWDRTSDISGDTLELIWTELENDRPVILKIDKVIGNLDHFVLLVSANGEPSDGSISIKAIDPKTGQIINLLLDSNGQLIGSSEYTGHSIEEVRTVKINEFDNWQNPGGTKGVKP